MAHSKVLSTAAAGVALATFSFVPADAGSVPFPLAWGTHPVTISVQTGVDGARFSGEIGRVHFSGVSRQPNSDSTTYDVSGVDADTSFQVVLSFKRVGPGPAIVFSVSGSYGVTAVAGVATLAASSATKTGLVTFSGTVGAHRLSGRFPLSGGSRLSSLPGSLRVT